MRIEILSSAIEDLDEGRVFYEILERGVGDYFQDCIFSEIDSLVLYGGIHRIVYGHYRLLSKRFPYAIYYRISQPDLIIIHRVLDCRRDPTKLRESLKPKGEPSS